MNKLISVFIVTLFIVACAQDKSYTEKLQEQILKSYNTPIRPGYEGRNPYWNKFAKKFMYAPAFDFKAVEGAKTYRYTVKESVEDRTQS